MHSGRADSQVPALGGKLRSTAARLLEELTLLRLEIGKRLGQRRYGRAQLAGVATSRQRALHTLLMLKDARLGVADLGIDVGDLARKIRRRQGGRPSVRY